MTKQEMQKYIVKEYGERLLFGKGSDRLIMNKGWEVYMPSKETICFWCASKEIAQNIAKSHTQATGIKCIINRCIEIMYTDGETVEYITNKGK